MAKLCPFRRRHPCYFPVLDRIGTGCHSNLRGDMVREATALRLAAR